MKIYSVWNTFIKKETDFNQFLKLIRSTLGNM